MSENHISLGDLHVPIQYKSVLYLCWQPDVSPPNRKRFTENLNSRLKYLLDRVPPLVDPSGQPYGRTSFRLMVNTLNRKFPNGTLVLEVTTDNREGLEFLLLQTIRYLERCVPVTIATE